MFLSRLRLIFRILPLTLLVTLSLLKEAAAALPDLIEQLKPSIVIVGTYSKTRNPPFVMRGTGFVVGNGNQIATNAHVVPDVLDSAHGEFLVVLIHPGQPGAQVRPARTVATDKPHDIALLRVDGAAMPAMTLHSGEKVREGESVAFMGFPIGGLLGFSPVTHRGIISAITPVAEPGATSRQLNSKVIKRLRSGSFDVYQLDGTAYPGNSGGPLFDMEKGEVVGVMNMVLVKGTKESVLTHPSGISYAIPVVYLKELLQNLR